jgi:hypothetical protein
MALGFNERDPRFQRERQRAASKASMRGGQLSRAAEGAVVGRHAANQMSRGLAFERLGLQSRMAQQRFDMAKTRIAQADKERGLRKDDLKFRKDIFKDRMADRRSNLRWTIGLGLGTAGLSFMEGRRRSAALEAERQRRVAFETRTQEQFDKQDALMQRLASKL